MCCIYKQDNPQCCAYHNCQHRGLLLSNMISGFLPLIVIFTAYTTGLKGQQYLGSNSLSSHRFFQCISPNAQRYQNVFQSNSYSSFGLQLTLLNIFILGVICLMQLNSVQRLIKNNWVTVLFFWSLLKARIVSGSSLDTSKLYAVQAFNGWVSRWLWILSFILQISIIAFLLHFVLIINGIIFRGRY